MNEVLGESPRILIPDEITATPTPEVAVTAKPAPRRRAASTKPPVPAEATEPVVEPVRGRDWGSWKYTPWKGNDMWTHGPTGRTTFSEAEAKKHRRL